MNLLTNIIRNNWIILVIIIVNLISCMSLLPLNTNRIDYGLADHVPQWEYAAGNIRRRRIRRIVFWRYIITLIARNRNAGVLVPRIYVEKLSQHRTFQRIMHNRAKSQRQQFRARIREFERYLQTHTDEVKQLIEQYHETIADIKSKLSFADKPHVWWRRLKLALVFHCQRLRDMHRERQVSLAILFVSIIVLSLSIVMDKSGYAVFSSPLCAGAVMVGISIIKNNHREYKKLTDQLVKSGYQPVLDYGWLVESNPSVLYPTVLDNFDWSLFNDLARKYQRCYSDFLAQQRTELTANDKCAQIDFLSFFSPLESESANSFNCPIELAEGELAEIVRLKSKKNGGRRFEHDFMPLFKTFVILRYMDIKPSVTNVIRTLCGNPYLLVKLQFKHNQLPSQRVIYRFDQVMSHYGLWNEASELCVFDNIKRGVIDPRKERFFGQDTTHVEACATKSKKNKQCAHCPNVADCKHPRLTDNTAGVLVKKRTEHHHAHKLALGNLLYSELCLAFKVFKGNTNDGKTFSPLLEMVKQKFPEFNFSHIFVDGIYDDEDCYEASKTYYPQAKLIPSRINPRNRNDKPIENRGILLVNKRGQAVCINRQKMVFVSRELKKQSYIWGCPVYHPDVTTDKKFTAKQKYQIIEQYKYSRDLSGTAKRHGITPKILRVWVSRMQCAKDKKLDPKGLRGLEDECPLKDQCCPDAKMGRIFRTKAFDYPFIDWELPQFSYQRRVLVALRLANERIISRLKENLSGDKLFKQNDFNVEAHVAKSLLAQHIFASVAFRLEHPEGIRRIKTFHAMFQ